MRNFAKVALKEKQIIDLFDNKVSKLTKSPKSTDELIKSYETIPGPKGILGIGTFYHYFPVIGKLI